MTLDTDVQGAIVDAWGAVYNGGRLVIGQDATDSVTITLQNPAFGADVNGIASLQGVPLSANATAAVAAANVARLQKSDGTFVTGDLYVSTPASVAWATATAYVSGDKRTHGGKHWECTENHTSDADTEPGTGPSWRDVWKLINLRLVNTNIAVNQEVRVTAFDLEVPASF